ncbi:hypothetical protein DEJ51_03430 [Streptomyces venezuelae]|uniref:Uncharacterized protein n=1 Tax=Streptomyces venezuelae TaxID=54571 RepID=A0A5P2DKF6_STRVZ|nr:hypothetical protein [Streptomyces venezuelae]QES53419.1 hypothetical protein DEJ51_03430 [Streptomyces venezuelae]
MTSRNRRAVQLYEITYLGTGPEPEVRTVDAGEVAAVIEYAGEHGMQVRVRPCRRPVEEPSTKKEGAS